MGAIAAEGLWMTLEICLAATVAFVIASSLTLVIRRMALSRGRIALTHNNSSRVVATPRDGWLAIVTACLLALYALSMVHGMPKRLFAALEGGGIAVAMVGLLDERKPGVAIIRLAVQLGASMWAMACLGGWTLPGVSSAHAGPPLIHLDLLGFVAGTLGMVWFLNLFELMDGIDGICAAEAVFMACGAVAIVLFTGGSSVITSSAIVLGAAAAGFLCWNWPPARIFMDGVGSGFLGYVLAVLAVAAGGESGNRLWVWVILAGVFLVDPTLTLVRRMVRGERWTVEHHSHAYQWLARRWSGHRPVMSAVVLLNVLWLLPCAVVAELNPEDGPLIALAALLPVAAIALASGAGRREALR